MCEALLSPTNAQAGPQERVSQLKLVLEQGAAKQGWPALIEALPGKNSATSLPSTDARATILTGDTSPSSTDAKATISTGATPEAVSDLLPFGVDEGKCATTRDSHDLGEFDPTNALVAVKQGWPALVKALPGKNSDTSPPSTDAKAAIPTATRSYSKSTKGSV